MLGRKLGYALAAVDHYAERWQAAEEANEALRFARYIVTIVGIMLVGLWLLD